MLMSHTLEILMYQVGQIFLIPTLLVITLMFLYSFYALGAFLFQGWQRGRQPMGADAAGFALIAWAHARPQASDDDLDLRAHKLMEGPRIASRVTPLLGLVATMIPMGPALKGLSDGNLAQVSSNLTVAFSAVILALIAAAITFWVANVRRRWLAEEVLEISRTRAQGAA
jgi:biopolymer transport protein ExbB/TolQ